MNFRTLAALADAKGDFLFDEALASHDPSTVSTLKGLSNVERKYANFLRKVAERYEKEGI